MSHGVVLVTTSNRHPDELYKNGIQRESFIPCINLLKTALRVVDINSPTDYRKVPRTPSNVYHQPLDQNATYHAQWWFEHLGDPVNDPPHPASQTVWGREIKVPLASGRAAWFGFRQLIGSATSAADYLELVRHYDAFVVTDIPELDIDQRDLVRRFITFLDAVYESRVCFVFLGSFLPAGDIDLEKYQFSLTLTPTGKTHPNQRRTTKKHLLTRIGREHEQTQRWRRVVQGLPPRRHAHSDGRPWPRHGSA